MSNSVDYGIDLGTTNSCIAHWEAGAVRVFQNNDHMNVTPSAVHVVKTGRVIVGRRAYAAVLADPENVAVEFKRWMGQKHVKRFAAAGRELSAEALSAEILKALKDDVRRQSEATVEAAVITVPAAFGALQCEATARAAELAGLAEAPLLQEPIAAAIGYGVTPASADQRWLVFDLGGGTLDIAVVSTREGRLNVLEHRGDNLLGGKDIDRAIVEQVLLPAVDAGYSLQASGPGSARTRVIARLKLKAEEAKIDLSRDEQVLISLFDVGVDDAGTPIELEVSLQRARLEQLMRPLFDKCCGLALEALAGARLRGSDLDRILLVGGPTQTPLLRSMLQARLGAPVDTSMDPMTVVGRGAAVYASTLERTSKPARSAASDNDDRVALKLVYEPVSAEPEAIVAGRVLSAAGEIELKLDADSGLWTSGWIRPNQGIFELSVALKPGGLTTFWVYARDAAGKLLETDSPEIKIRHGLVPSAPPLPHTLAVEVVDPQGRVVLDPVFAKGTPLPADKRIKYRATHALIPSKPDSKLAIKLWEGECFDDPEANDWVGNVILAPDAVRRPVPEGSEIELTIHVNASRLISVDAFVPHLNQNFSERLYVPQHEEQDFAQLSQNVSVEIADYRQRLDRVERSAQDPGTLAEVADLRRSLEQLAPDEAASRAAAAGTSDPDDARRVVERSKQLRRAVGRLERKTDDNRAPATSAARLELIERAEQVVTQFGTTLEKQELGLLTRELERATAKSDQRAIQRVCDDVDALRFRVLSKHDWFWREMFESLSASEADALDPVEARRLIDQGRAAIANADGAGLRTATRALWALHHPDRARAADDRAVATGLRRF